MLTVSEHRRLLDAPALEKKEDFIDSTEHNDTASPLLLPLNIAKGVTMPDGMLDDHNDELCPSVVHSFIHSLTSRTPA